MRFAVVHARGIHELILEIIDDIVMQHILFRENDHTLALCQMVQRFAESGQDTGIAVHRDHM